MFPGKIMQCDCSCDTCLIPVLCLSDMRAAPPPLLRTGASTQRDMFKFCPIFADTVCPGLMTCISTDADSLMLGGSIVLVVTQ